MHCLHLNMMDISFTIKSPFEIILHESIRPFLSESWDSPQFVVEMIPVSSLPPAQDGFWIDDRYYANNRVFFRNLYNLPPYAMVENYQDRIVCLYLPEFERYVHGCDSILNMIGIEKLLLERSGFLLHASLIRYHDKAILFSAPCGTGKSTQASLWENYKDAEILNGDRAGIRFVDGIWMAYGMPFAGTSGIYKNSGAPICAVVTLAQSGHNVVHKLRIVQSISKILPEISCRRWDSSYMTELMNVLERFLLSVPVYNLECRPDQDAVETLHDILGKERLL